RTTYIFYQVALINSKKAPLDSILSLQHYVIAKVKTLGRISVAGFSKIAIAFALLCVSAVSFGQVKNRIVQPINKSQMVQLRGNVHPLTRVGTDLGRVN